MQRYYKTYFFLITACLLLSGLTVMAQTNYSTDPNYVRSRSDRSVFYTRAFESAYPDTNVGTMFNFVPRNFLGNLGQPSPNLFPTYTAENLGFRLYPFPYGLDRVAPGDVNYYQTKGPFASLEGIAGSKRLQMFRMLYSHTFKNNLNLSAHFKRYGATGFYKRQKSQIDNFYLSSNYTTRNKRFGYYAYFLVDKYVVQDNGGIKDDSLFVDDINVGKNLLPVYLSASAHEIRTLNAHINPWFRLNKSDSANVNHFLQYKGDYSGNFYQYTDDAWDIDNYYQHVYLDTVRTNDSTHVRQFTNQLNYALQIRPAGLWISVGAKNETTQLYQHADSTLRNNFLLGDVVLDRPRYQSHLQMQYIVDGSNANDYAVEWQNRIFFSSDSVRQRAEVFVNVQTEQRHPDYLYQRNFSNNFMWNYKFSSESRIQGLVGIRVPKWKLSLSASAMTVSNYLYFNSLALPSQYKGDVMIFSVKAQKDFLFFRHLGFNNQVIWQDVSKKDLLPIPTWYVQSQLFVVGDLFKKNLRLQFGVQMEYYSSFAGYNYMPAYNVFYLQNTRTVGDYPYFDVFLSARIKPVRFFVKVDNVLQSFMGRGYTLSPGYMQNDLAFRFGINWLFFD